VPGGLLCIFNAFLRGARGVVKSKVVFASLLMAASLALGGCYSTGTTTPGAQAYASADTAPANGAWMMPTPFGILYGQVPSAQVAYKSGQSTGTIIVDTKKRYLYYVTGKDTAIRYNIAVGREGYNWSGVSHVSQKREWPDWTPTPAILKEHPNLPKHVEGGYDNPLGARALYLGATLYRIHGTNEPWRIGAAVSSGCIRLSNNDIIDLYNRAHVGAKVIVR